jgi:hypothetical protein
VICVCAFAPHRRECLAHRDECLPHRCECVAHRKERAMHRCECLAHRKERAMHPEERVERADLRGEPVVL